MIEFGIAIMFGIVLGLISGLTPGIHTNTFALILVSSAPFFIKLGFSPEAITLIIVSNAVVHTFLDIIPSVFLGAPEADSALAILPMHEMLLEGNGVEAIKISASGSLISSLLTMSLLPPVFFFIIYFSNIIERYTVYALIVIVVTVLLTEKGEHIYGLGKFSRIKFMFFGGTVFILSGLLGVFSFKFADISNSIVPITPNVLFPLLTGLFGAPMLLISYFNTPEIPAQTVAAIKIPFKNFLRGFSSGVMAGFLVSLFPGVSNGVATVISRLSTPSSNHSGREFITSISSANTSNAIFSLLILYAIGRTRSGAGVFIKDILFPISQNLFLFWIAGILVSSLLGYQLTVYIGERVARNLNSLNYRKLTLTIFLFLFILVMVFNGIFGVIIFILSIATGLIPVFTGVRRVNCMGVLLLPLILAKI